MEKIKTVLLCCSRFAFPAMQQLAYTGILGGVIIPEQHTKLIEETKESLGVSNIPVVAVNKKNFEEVAIRFIADNNINLGLVVTFNFTLPNTLFTKPTKGFYNVHPGPLPQYRGSDPIFHQIKNREKYSAVTIHQLDEGLDSGAIILQEKIGLLQTDTYGLLEVKLARLAQKLVETLTKIIAMGFNPPSRPQKESKAICYPKQEPKEFTIDWNTMKADAIIALTNACNPYNNGAATLLNHKLIRFLHVEKIESATPHQMQPGTILFIDADNLEIATLAGEHINVKFLYTEEGYLTPASLLALGVTKGLCFKPTVF
jgi:methionyl-tRNA formyltransferase